MINFRMLSLKVAIVIGMYFLSTLLVNSCTQQESTAQAPKPFANDHPVGDDCYQNKFTVDGMEYVLVYGKYDGGIHFVNLTKEKLEIELLKKQLNGK